MKIQEVKNHLDHMMYQMDGDEGNAGAELAAYLINQYTNEFDREASEVFFKELSVNCHNELVSRSLDQDEKE